MPKFSYTAHTYPVFAPEPVERTQTFGGPNPLCAPPAGEYYENYIRLINRNANERLHHFDCGISFAPRGKVIPERTTGGVFIKCLLAGRLRCNGMTMEAGDLLVLEPQTPNSWVWETDARLVWCTWSGEIAATVISALRCYPPGIPYPIQVGAQLAELVESVVYCRHYEQMDAERYIVGFTEQLLGLLTPIVQPIIRPNLSPLIRRAQAIIERDYAHLTVERLAIELFVDPSYLARAFHRETGESPKQAITRVRMEYAEYYLIGTNYSLSRIAELVGYANYTNFYVAFRARFGCSPDAYRRRCGR